MGVPNATVRRDIELLIGYEGMQIKPADWASDLVADTVSRAAFVENTVGAVIAALGISNALPAVNPVVITPQGGMNLQAGGGAQWMIAQDRPLDHCPPVPLAVPTADATLPRIDLICVQATRVPGVQQVTRRVRSDAAPTNVTHLSVTLAAGVGVVALPAGFTSAPVVDGLAGFGANSGGGIPRPTAVSTSAVTITSVKADGSTDTTDVRTVNFEVYGNPVGATGLDTALTLRENRPAWRIVPGTPSSTPSAPGPPDGWEAFATVSVAAGATVITSSNISVLFGTITTLVGGLLAENGWAPMLGGGIDEWGVVRNVLADGTGDDLAVSFPRVFPVECLNIVYSIDTGASTPASGPLGVTINSLTAVGFKLTVSGGSPGQTVTVRFRALGH